MKRSQKKEHEKCTFIREVNINYRTTKHQRTALSEPDAVAEFVRSVLVDNSREHFVAIYLDSANQVDCYSIISIGTANSTILHPREVFQRALAVGSISVIVAHNHPSGVLTPSESDVETTERLITVGELVGIRLIDHVIISQTSHLSLRGESDLW